MTDYRERAASEIAGILGLPWELVKAWADDPGNEYLTPANRNIARWALEREARLRLEDLLCDCILQLSAHEGDSDRVKEFRAALNAVKEG